MTVLAFGVTVFLSLQIVSRMIQSAVLIINEFFLDRIFFIPAELIKDAKGLIRILISLSIIEFWSASIIRIAEGFQNYFLVRVIESVKWVLRAGFIVIATSMGYGLAGIGAAYLAAGLLILIVLYLAVFAGNSSLVIGIRFMNMDSFKSLFGFSIWIFLSKMFAFLAYRIDTIVIGIFLPPANIAYYNIAFKMYEIVRYGFSLLSSTLIPVTSELNALADKVRLNLLFQKATRYTVLIIYPVLTFIFFYSETLIRLWVGDGFEASASLSRLFMISLFFAAVVSIGSEMMVGLNRLRELILYSGIASAINLVLSIILVKKIGVSGVVIGTVIGTIFIMISYLYCMMKVFNQSILNLWRDILIRPIIITVVMSLLFFSVGSIYLAVLISAAFFLFIFLFMIDKEDRDLIYNMALLKNGYYKNRL